MELVLLGTAGGPTPKLNRSAPAQALIVNGQVYVVDCGNGVARQLVRAGLALTDLRGVFITHHHSDHNIDYGALLLLAWASGLSDVVDTYGPPPLERMTQAVLDLHEIDIESRVSGSGRQRPRVSPHEVDDRRVVHVDDHVTVTSTVVNHPPIETALAYRFDSADSSVVISGDTTMSPAVVELAQGADVLVHECLYPPALDAMVAADPSALRLREHLVSSHTSVDDVGRVAQQAGVSTLVLSHLVPSGAEVTDDMWTARAAREFSGTVVVGRDLLVI